MAEVSTDGPLRKLFGLLMDPKVQKELDLVGPQLMGVAQAMKPVKESFQSKIKEVQNLPDSVKQQARQSLLREIISQIDTALEGALRAEQLQRFKQLRLQKDGLNMFIEESVQKSLSLSGPSLMKVKNILYTLARETTKIQQGAPGDRLEKIASLQADARRDIDAVLSDEQKETLKNLLGDPFEFDPVVDKPAAPANSWGPNLTNPNRQATGSAGKAATPNADPFNM